MNCDIATENWPDSDWEELARLAAMAACTVEPALGNERLSTSILFTTDAQVRMLNREWRGKDRPTNVLSFPMLERADLVAMPAHGPPELLGDIALAHETCANEALAKGIGLRDHTAHLIVHGLLHLAGHDHVEGDTQAEAMEALEIKALAEMGIADPYGDRDIRETTE